MDNPYFEKLKVDKQTLGVELADLSDSKDLLFNFAAATWSLICEPGDTISGLLRSTLGFEESLLQVVSGVTAKEIAKELREYSNALDVEQAIANKLEVWRSRALQGDVYQCFQSLRQLGGKLITSQSEYWPKQLDDLGFGSPPALWFIGDIRHFRNLHNSVAVVGSRVCSDYGVQVTKDIVKNLVQSGQPIVSGGALGIDAVAHQAAISNRGTTVAVMAGGLDRLYPAQNIELFKEITKTGLLISEVAPRVFPTKWRFLQRNRLIAALSCATVVIEAGVRSGTINTVGHANELGRPVGAVPGPITSVRSAGCHQLIKDGRAQLLSIPSDLRDLCGETEYFERSFESLSQWEVRALDSLSTQPKSIAEISKYSGLSSFEAETGLAKLAKAGLASHTSNGWLKP
jgi:DNA processing protein